MAWYVTGTIAVSGTTVTGTGTNFLDNTQSIGPGQALLIPGSGTVKMYEIASVQSATKLTLKTSAGTIAAGQAYAILSFYTDSVPDFARRLAAQLSYYQSQMDGWQQIMTGTGSITMTAPDGTTVTISSFSKLTADISNSLQQRGQPTTQGIADINSMGPTSAYIGVWDFRSSADFGLLNVPEASSGTLEVFSAGAYSGTQRYTSRYGGIYVRCLAANWSASAPSWGPWCLSGSSYRNQSSVDLNTLTNAQFVGGTLTNGPAAMGNATCFVNSIMRASDASLISQTLTYTTTGRIWTRTCVSGTWTAWAESLTTNNGLQLSGGTMTGPIAMGGKDITGGGVISGTEINSSSGLNAPKIELSGSTPFIDFHFNNSTADYTARIINTSTAPTLEVSAPTSGTARLRVNGGYQCKGGINGGYGGNCFNFYWQTNSKCEAWIDSSNIGYLSLEAASDKQLKKDIEYKDSTGALAEILQWKVASFKYKARGIIPESDSQIGFIANDLFEVSPECVDGDGLPEDYDIDKEPNKAGAYNLRQVPMIAKLTMAIQEQQKLISSMSDAIQELERAIANKQ
ncbi:pyocin knob domain-containing S74 family peptidase [Candidatus Pantoea formicae]|uniref:pyocin knob domain-containing S74 family peptidase n=1 Tax=Candidatus Pantoea formicae TaxID=2608355 RepID=UPI003ED8E3F3